MQFGKAKSLQCDLRDDVAWWFIRAVFVFYWHRDFIMPFNRISASRDSQPAMQQAHGGFGFVMFLVAACRFVAHSVDFAHFLIGRRHAVFPLRAEP